MTPAQVALNQRRLSKAYGGELTFDFDIGLDAPLLCTFTDTEDGPALAAALIGGVDIYRNGDGRLINDAMVRHIEAIAYSHLERQAEQINAERRFERQAA